MQIVREFQKIAEKKKCSAGQLALAWVIAQGAIPIPGTKNAGRLEENWGARDVELDEDEDAAETIGDERPGDDGRGEAERRRRYREGRGRRRDAEFVGDEREDRLRRVELREGRDAGEEEPGDQAAIGACAGHMAAELGHAPSVRGNGKGPVDSETPTGPVIPCTRESHHAVGGNCVEKKL